MLQDAFQSQHRTKLYSGQCGRYSGKLSSPASLPVYSSQGVSYPVTAQSSCGWSAENCPGPPGPPWVEAEVMEDLLVVCLPCPRSLHALISPPPPPPPRFLPGSAPCSIPLAAPQPYLPSSRDFALRCVSPGLLRPQESAQLIPSSRSGFHLVISVSTSSRLSMAAPNLVFLSFLRNFQQFTSCMLITVPLSLWAVLSVLYIAGLPVLRGEPGTVCRLCECRCPVEWVGWFAPRLGLWLWSSRWTAERRSQGHGVT